MARIRILVSKIIASLPGLLVGRLGDVASWSSWAPVTSVKPDRRGACVRWEASFDAPAGFGWFWRLAIWLTLSRYVHALARLPGARAPKGGGCA